MQVHRDSAAEKATSLRKMVFMFAHSSSIILAVDTEICCCSNSIIMRSEQILLHSDACEKNSFQKSRFCVGFGQIVGDGSRVFRTTAQLR